MNQPFSLRTGFGLALALSAVVNAEPVPEPLEVAPDDVVVIVATRTPVPLSKVGNSVTVLDGAAIRDSQAVAVSDVLAQTPGLSVIRNGGAGQTTSVFMRGADSDQTLVLIDGVQVNDPSSPSGGFDFSGLLTGDIARIEILRGAQSTLYGSQAIGGVVNIITADPHGDVSGSASAEGGSHGTGSFAGNLGGRSGGLSWQVAANYFNTSGIPAFDERLGGKRDCAASIEGLAAHMRYDFSPEVQLDERAYATHARTDFDGYDTPQFTFGDDSEYGAVTEFVDYTGLTWRVPDAQLSNRFAFQYTDTNRRNYDPHAGPVTETFYGLGHNMRWEYQGTWDVRRDVQAVFGAQHERSTIDTDSPAFDITPSPLRAAASIDSAYGQLQDELVSGLTLTVGGRYDHHSVFGGHGTAQAAGAWVLNGGATLVRASFGQGFKAPSLYQLFSAYGNLALRPEQANSWDAGVEQHAWGDRILLLATYFHRDSRDLINFFDCATPSPLCATEPFGYYANIARSSARGLELQASVTPMADLDLTANYTYTDAVDRSAGSATFGDALPRRPKSVANLISSFRWPVRVTTTLAIRYAGRSFDDAANSIALGGYVVVDLRASYPLGNGLELYGRLQNLADKRYETAYQYGQPRREAFVGLRKGF